MGGSKPEWADASDHATLEEVFTSRSFGQPASRESPPSAVLPAPIAASKLYFVRNRFIASGAAAAAALVGRSRSEFRGGAGGAVSALRPLERSGRSRIRTTPTTTIPSQTNSGPAALWGQWSSWNRQPVHRRVTGPERDRADILGERARRREFRRRGGSADADRDPDRGRHRLARSGHGRAIHYDADDARHPQRRPLRRRPRPRRRPRRPPRPFRSRRLLGVLRPSGVVAPAPTAAAAPAVARPAARAAAEPVAEPEAAPAARAPAAARATLDRARRRPGQQRRHRQHRDRRHGPAATRAAATTDGETPVATGTATAGTHSSSDGCCH